MDAIDEDCLVLLNHPGGGPEDTGRARTVGEHDV